jgi:hypothetical protein
MKRKIPTILFAVIGSFAWQSAIPPNGACSANDTNDTEYLIFWSGLPGASSPGNYEAGIRNFAAKLGTTGDGVLSRDGWDYRDSTTTISWANRGWLPALFAPRISLLEIQVRPMMYGRSPTLQRENPR